MGNASNRELLQKLFNSLNENGRTPIEQRNADAKAKQELETIQQT